MKTYGLVGKNISYSFSKKYFTDKFEKEKHLGCKYQNFEIATIHQITAILNDPSICGLNVTIPYKEAVIPFLDRLSEDAESIGAVNTIKFLADGSKVGYNTDYIGFKESITPLLLTHHTKALILGTGGSSKAIAYALKQLNIPFLKVSRKKDTSTISYEQITKELLEEYTIIINCTPIGTYPNIENLSPIETDTLNSRHLVYDLVYNPELTTLLLKAKIKGATVKNGYEMLKTQAERAWEIWNL